MLGRFFSSPAIKKLVSVDVKMDEAQYRSILEGDLTPSRTTVNMPLEVRTNGLVKSIFMF